MESRGRLMVQLCKKEHNRKNLDVNVIIKEKKKQVGSTKFDAVKENSEPNRNSSESTRHCTMVEILEISTENSAINTDVQLATTPAVIDELALENYEDQLSNASDFSSDHSEYVPENLSMSSDTDVSLQKSLSGHDNLEGMQVYPETTPQPRKRLLKSNQWKRNIAKNKRARGEEYVSSRNKIIPAVKINPPCSNSCRKKCYLKFQEEERLEIFKRYWDLAEYTRQRDFINSNTTKEEIKGKTINKSRRNSSTTFFLPKSFEKIAVCKTMFLNNLGIKKGVVDIALAKRTAENTTFGDKRGKFVKKATPQTVIEKIKDHIESFPSVPSHYCRSGTKRQYLCSSLNITLMYKLYCSLRDSRNEEKASEPIYRKIFNENYNLGFHRPRKDRCRFCMSFENASADEKRSLEAAHSEHLKAKELARAEKNKNKWEAEVSNGQIICANFDLQQVLLVPTDPTNNALFYKRRLATYNFTIYNVVSKQGDCFMWSEVQGKRGSCETSSCVHKYLKSLPITTREVTFFSDRCGGQNLNRFMAAMCMIAVQEITNIETINLKFLVVGHSEMECDSMHSTIGTEFERIGKALWPEDWKNIARGARRKNSKPYLIHDLQLDEIMDYKKFVENNMCIRKTDENGVVANWQKMSWLRFNKNKPFILEFKESFDGEFRILNFNKKTRRTEQTSHLQPLYTKPIPISEAKYKDLNSLFTMKPPALSDCYKPFYNSLPYCGNMEDFASESSSEDEN